MPLESVSTACSIVWEMFKTVSGFENLTQGPNNKSFKQNPDTATWNQLYAAVHSLASGGGTTTINFRSFTNAVGESVTTTNGILELYISVSGAGSSVDVEPGASDGLTWFMGGPITLVDGSAFKFAQTTSQTVDATHKNITLTNNGGSGTASVTVVAIVKTP